ncbi:site-specific integrase [Lentzea cavernae]|uniref:Phage integrase n=1 Tax=Lentzea cavernae TaxID=2020703 RepID=A0ABQ3MUU6_9PSEU|nr:site-specific integrase [Lentzea cavernae]GHH59836.1 phage integrase [Lentzea cavernae]
MARPRLPIGTHGEIRCYPAANGKWRAVTLYRDYDGVTRPVERTGATRAKATTKLKEALRDRGRIDASAEITQDTTFKAVAELWFADIDAEVQSGKKSPNTGSQYRDRLDQQIIPALGELRMSEVTVSRVDRVVKDTVEKNGNAVAKMTRTVLSGVLGLATRHDAFDSNPVRDVRRIESDSNPARALELKQAQELRAFIAADPKAVARDLVDFTDMMLATGFRIGETAGIVWDAVDLDAATVEVRAIVIRVRGVGLVLKPKPKSKSGYRTVELPSWAVAMLRRRRPANPAPGEPIFPAPMGGLRDPSNTNADLKEVFTAAGYAWVTSHVYRKTVASMMDDAGLSARAAADQLGHAKVSMTQDNYFKRKVAKTGAAKVLEPIAVTEHTDRSTFDA